MVKLEEEDRWRGDVQGTGVLASQMHEWDGMGWTTQIKDS